VKTLAMMMATYGATMIMGVMPAEAHAQIRIPAAQCDGNEEKASKEEEIEISKARFSEYREFRESWTLD